MTTETLAEAPEALEPARRSRGWMGVVALILFAAAISVALLLGACSAKGYDAWSAKVTTYTVMGGDHQIDATVLVTNTGTVAAMPACYVDAWTSGWVSERGEGSVNVMHPVQPGASVTLVIPVPVRRSLAADATELYANCA